MAQPKAHMNQLWNSKNCNQGPQKRVLTICSAGLLRSPTTAQFLEQTYDYNCRAAGIVEEYALIPVSEVLIHWADEFVFMEQTHFDEFMHIWETNYVAKEKIEAGAYQILDIPDNYQRNHKTLRQLIAASYNEKLNLS